MKISEIYEKYKIMPQLQEHMLRVAGVASIICDNFTKPLDKNSIISACLLHDMGNIIKFDLDWTQKIYPQSFDEKSIGFWKKVKDEFIERYGNHEHTATYKILDELGVSKKISSLVQAFGFSKAKLTYEDDIFENKIAAYSDHRTNPHGVVPIHERFLDLKIRYKDKIKIGERYFEFEKLCSYWLKIEKQIFAHCKIKPEDITEEKVKPLISKSRNFNIQTQ